MLASRLFGLHNSLQKAQGHLKTEGLRREFLGWESAGFDSAGPFGKRTPSVLSQLQRAFRYVESIEEGTIVPGGWADQAMDAFRAGELTLDETRMTISAYLFPTFDTTILTAGNMLYELAENPDLIASAVDEAVRHASAVRCFTRYTADDYSTEDVFIPKGKRVVILYPAANRDERDYEHPNEFLVTRSAKDNLGFGSGTHVCAGQHLAKMEIKVLLQSLLKHANTIESDTPSRLVNAGVWGYTRLPMRLA